MFGRDFTAVQRSLCGRAGYEWLFNGRGAWARDRALPKTFYRPLDSATKNSQLAIGLVDEDIELLERGWFALSEQNCAALWEIVPEVRAAADDAKIGTVPFGLTFHPIFNAESYVRRGFVLVHAPLMYGLDWLGTFGIALSHLRPLADEDRRFVAQVSQIEGAVSGLLDIISGKTRWGQEAMRPVLSVLTQSEGPDLRYARMGYYVAAAQRIWILLHEAAHIVKNHRWKSGTASWDQELQADQYASARCAEMAKKRQGAHWKFFASAIPLLLDIFSALERRVGTGSPTHPTAAGRRQQLLDARSLWQPWFAAAEDDPFKGL